MIACLSLGLVVGANRIWSLRGSHFEINVIMVSTPRIELLTANRAARFALHVLADGQLCAAGSAKYRLLVPFALWPNPDLVIGQNKVAIFARIVNPAALHLDRDDVRGSVVMCTTGLGINIDTAHGRRIRRHCSNQRTRKFSRLSAALQIVRRPKGKEIGRPESGAPRLVENRRRGRNLRM